MTIRHSITCDECGYCEETINGTVAYLLNPKTFMNGLEGKHFCSIDCEAEDMKRRMKDCYKLPDDFYKTKGAAEK